MEIIEADPQHLSTVHELFVEYRQSLNTDLYFQDFDQELATLPGYYAPPGGAIFLLRDGKRIQGCCALRSFTKKEAELKRLYIRPPYRGRGHGRRLLETALAKAATIGYRSIVLDTLPDMHAARQLYRVYGFRPTTSYYPNPIDGVECLRLELQ